MLNTSLYDQTEQLAKKHGKSINQKSNFKYLLKEKINRNVHTNQKQNDRSLFIASSLNKYAQPLNYHRGRATTQFNQVILNPATTCQFNRKSYAAQNRYTNTKEPQCNEKSLQQLGNQQSNNLVTLPLTSNFTGNFELIQTSCMTQQCFYAKQLEIRLGLIKKQRDQLWDSITDIVRQNQTLKEIMATLTINAQLKENKLIQTQISSNVVQVQTDLLTEDIITNNQSILQLEHKLKKTEQEIQQTVQFCKSLYPLDIQAQNCHNLKDAFTQYLNYKMQSNYKQFQLEKRMIDKIYEQEVNDLRDCQDRLRIQMSQLNQEKQSIMAIKQQLEHQLCRQSQQILQYQQKNCQIINQIMLFQDIVKKVTNQNDLIKEYHNTEKKGWEEKQRVYSILLTESHKTINSLTLQMKQFESLSRSTYYKHLKSQKNTHGLATTFSSQISE